MQVGDKLYKIVDWGDLYFSKKRFQIYTHTVTKINSKTIEVWGCYWKVKKSELGWKFFISKKEMYKYNIKKYKEELKEISLPVIKAIKILSKRLAKEKQNEIK